MTELDDRLSQSLAQLAERQRAGVTAWRNALELREAAELARQESREARLEASRKLDALRRADAALQARVELAAASHATDPRAVVAHRQDWVREKVALALVEQGIDVLVAVEDGAEALGVSVAEQPELLVLEGRLPSLLAVDLVRDIRTFSPATLVAAQVESDQEIAPLVEAGARVVFGRQLHPGQVAEHVVSYLRTRPDEVLLLT
jgi:CheY-like chemotaxis protein